MAKPTYTERLAHWNVVNGTNFKLIGDYVNPHTNTLHRCQDCGYEWSPRPCNMQRNNSSCPACFTGPKLERFVRDGRRKHADYVRALPDKIQPGTRVVSMRFVPHTDPRVRRKTGISLRHDLVLGCDKCHAEWPSTIGNALSGRAGCPSCAGRYLPARNFDTKSFREHLLSVQPNLDVSKTFYRGAGERVKFSCPDHGERCVVARWVFKRSRYMCGLCESTKGSSETLFKRYGYHSALAVPEFFEKAMVSQRRVKTKEYNGRTYRYQGWENVVFDRLIDYYGSTNVVGQFDNTFPDWSMRDAGTRPDLYVEHRDLFVEVKSTWTLIDSRLSGVDWFKRNKEKAVSLESAGIRCRWVVVTSNRSKSYVVLPRDWYRMTKNRLRAYIKENDAKIQH